MQVAVRPETDVHDHTDVTEERTMTEIKSRVATGYEVDAEQVAREILRKVRLLKWARRELVSGPGRTPGRPARDL